MYKIFLILTIPFVFLSCKEQIEIRSNDNVVFEVTNGDDSFTSKIESYENYFIRQDGLQMFGFHKSGLFFNTYAYKFGGYTDENLYEESRLDKFFINEYSTRSFQALSSEEQALYVDEHLGETVTYKFIENGQEVYKELMHLPLEISIDTTSSNITKIGATNIANFKLGSSLYINQDTKNSDGLLVSLWYRGDNLNMTLDDIQNSNEEGVNIQKYMYVPKDSGVIKFPNDFFNELPDGAMFYLQINRLNFHVFNIGEKSHKLSAGTSYGIDLALER